MANVPTTIDRRGRVRVEDRMVQKTVPLVLVVVGGLLLALTLVLSVVTEDVIRHNGWERQDPAILQFFLDHRSAAVITAATWVTQLGSVRVLLPVAILAGLLLWWRGAPVGAAAVPLASLLLAGVLAGIGKTLIDRERPPVGLHLVPESDGSFPSGHSADSAAVYLAIALVVGLFFLRRPLARAVVVLGALLITGLVGISRLVLGVHWPTDVIAGWSAGLAAALVVVTAASVFFVRFDPVDPAGSTDRGPRRRDELVRLLVARRPPRHASGSKPATATDRSPQRRGDLGGRRRAGGEAAAGSRGHACLG